MTKLTTKQKAFIQAYLACGNASEAARVAEYPFPRIQASRNLASPIIQEAIRERLSEASPEVRAMFAARELVKSKKYGYIYFLMADNGLTKIGWASDFERRLAELNWHLPYELTVICLFESENAKETEQSFHKYFAHRRIRGKSEWFALTNEDIAEVPTAAYYLNAKQVK
jgi:hypothetical protein